MLKIFYTIVLLFVTLALAIEQLPFMLQSVENTKKDYTGYRVVEMVVPAQSVNELHETADVWSTEIVNGEQVKVTMMVPPSVQLQDSAEVSVVIEDLQAIIDRESQQQSLLESASFHGRYHSIEEVEQFMVDLHEKYPHQTELFEAGTTYEGRTMRGIKLSSANATGDAKHIVWNGGMHAREWIGPAVMCFLMEKLLETGSVIDSFVVHIVPIVNLDGYEYTRKSDRMWRKNRQPGTFCKGTDPNRNFDADWNGTGSSNNECSEIYRGTSRFSAPEAKALADYIAQVGDVVSYIDWHAYSQLWMYPYGASTKETKDKTDLNVAAKLATQALYSVNRKSFVYGQISKVIYVATGSSVDWTYTAQGVKYSYAVELRDTGRNGFMLPADQIVPSGEEVLASVVALYAYVAEHL